ncbi:hypothetical protein Hanom_Chr11g00976881 [Helianthus anomalus]
MLRYKVLQMAKEVKNRRLYIYLSNVFLNSLIATSWVRSPTIALIQLSQNKVTLKLDSCLDSP